MATRPAVLSQHDWHTVRVTWVGLLSGDVGEGVIVPAAPDKNVHFTGTFGAGGSIRLQGTNKDAQDIGNDPILHDVDGTVTDSTSAKMFQIKENPLLVYPRVTAGDGTTNLECRLIIKR